MESKITCMCKFSLRPSTYDLDVLSRELLFIYLVISSLWRYPN